MCKKTPRACSPSRLDDTYCTESSSEMDCLSYSPKSMSDMSVTSNELRMPTPLDHCNDANTSAIPMKLGNISNDQKDINRNPIDMDIKSTQLPCKLNESLMPILPSTTTLPMANTTNLGLNSNDAVYVDEFYRKISEYYRGIFSNIDIKDPNISSDVLNYYQLIRQFYEQTMAINIQRNTALGLGSLNASLTKIDTTVSNANLVVPPLNAAAASTLPAPTQNDVSTIDLTIHKPTTNESMIFNNIKNNNSFQNNININIGSGNDGEAVKERAVHETLLKMNDSSTDELGENKVTISSAGVSINVSSLNANSLKISCKTTPPKKRYSGYNDEANVVQKPSHASTTTATTPINLNRKFEAEAMTTAKRMRINSPHDDGISVKSNFSGNDDPKCSTARPESIKSSSTTTNVDSSSSMADVFPITSTYLQLMRSMGFNEDEALKFDNLVSKTFCFQFFCLFTICIELHGDNAKVDDHVDLLLFKQIPLTFIVIRRLLLNSSKWAKWKLVQCHGQIQPALGAPKSHCNTSDLCHTMTVAMWQHHFLRTAKNANIITITMITKKRNFVACLFLSAFFSQTIWQGVPLNLSRVYALDLSLVTMCLFAYVRTNHVFLLCFFSALLLYWKKKKTFTRQGETGKSGRWRNDKLCPRNNKLEWCARSCVAAGLPLFTMFGILFSFRSDWFITSWLPWNFLFKRKRAHNDRIHSRNLSKSFSLHGDALRLKLNLRHDTMNIELENHKTYMVNSINCGERNIGYIWF